MKLRHPNPLDIEGILRLAKEMHAESWYSSFDFDETKMRGFVEDLCGDTEFLALVLEHEEDGVVGFLLAADTEHFFGRDRYACDIALYMTPKHRGGIGVMRMIKAYEAWGRIRGVKELHLGISTGIAAERTGKFYERLGYHSPVMAYRKKCVWAPE